MTDSSHAPYMSHRDDPEWQAAQADYLSDEGGPDEAYARRVKAAFRMREIEGRYR